MRRVYRIVKRSTKASGDRVLNENDVSAELRRKGWISIGTEYRDLMTGVSRAKTSRDKSVEIVVNLRTGKIAVYPFRALAEERASKGKTFRSIPTTDAALVAIFG